MTRLDHFWLTEDDGDWRLRHDTMLKLNVDTTGSEQALTQAATEFSVFVMDVAAAPVLIVFDPEPISIRTPLLHERTAEVLWRLNDGQYSGRPVFVVRLLTKTELQFSYVTPDTLIAPGALAAAVTRVMNAWDEIPSVQLIRWYGGLLRVETRYENKQWSARVVP